ncbi:enoyl-CoA delta isomerase 3, peroxisomal isoform X2 [Calliopsis andreniformis]|uniref:enoyl-CoA delta isomerase 3, peroxisomal isoform X2 n=1 Tax=Calliopsis andreniformis TaxID=337506 RepID=UPI003FCC9127
MNNKDSSEILSFVEKGIRKIVLNQPKKRNAINISMYKKLIHILNESIDDSSTHVVVFTGAGNFFSSGNDFSSSLMTQDGNSVDIKSVIDLFKNFIDALITYPKLLIAVVNGPAVGMAVTILPLFDMVYASHMAYFQTPFTSLGLVAEGCSTYTFPKVFGQSKAGDMLYLGYRMNALEAKQYGLVSKVYEHDSLHDVWIYLKNISTLSVELGNQMQDSNLNQTV